MKSFHDNHIDDENGCKFKFPSKTISRIMILRELKHSTQIIMLKMFQYYQHMETIDSVNEIG